MAKAKKVDLRKVPKEIRALRKESTLPETFERMLEQCAFTLDMLHKRFGIDYLIHSTEHKLDLGTVELRSEEKTPARRGKRDGSATPWGSLSAHYLPYMENVNPDDLVQIPVGSFDAGRLQSSVAARATARWGKGSYTCVVSRDRQIVELWRLPTVGIREMLPSMRGGDHVPRAGAEAASETDD